MPPCHPFVGSYLLTLVAHLHICFHEIHSRCFSCREDLHANKRRKRLLITTCCCVSTPSTNAGRHGDIGDTYRHCQGVMNVYRPGQHISCLNCSRKGSNSRFGVHTLATGNVHYTYASCLEQTTESLKWVPLQRFSAMAACHRLVPRPLALLSPIYVVGLRSFGLSSISSNHPSTCQPRTYRSCSN